MSTSIRALFNSCSNALKSICSRLGRGDTSDTESLQLSRWQDELGRLRLWAANIGVDNHQSSLEIRLKDSSHIREQVANLLLDLGQMFREVEDGLDSLHNEQASQKEGDSFSDNDYDTAKELTQLHSNIVTAINCLFQMSMLVRNPAPHDLYVLPQSQEVLASRPFDQAHVGEKYPEAEEDKTQEQRKQEHRDQEQRDSEQRDREHRERLLASRERQIGRLDRERERRPGRLSDSRAAAPYARPRRDDDSRDTREPTGAARPPRQRLNEFFVDGARIHCEVMQREICKFLGPEAYSKPHSYNGIQGYLVSAIRPFTPDQLDDLQELSEAYELENQQMKKRGYLGIPYENSEVSRRQDASLRHADSADMMDDVYYPSQHQYTTASTQQGYPALTSSYAQPSGGLYAGSAYSTDPNYPVGSSYTTPYPSGSARPNDNYSYGNESPRNDPYRQPSGLPGSRDPRQDPRLEARYAQGRDTARMDPRDPRAIQQQPQGYGYSSAADISAVYAYAPPTPLLGRGIEPYPPPRASVYGSHRDEPGPDVPP